MFSPEGVVKASKRFDETTNESEERGGSAQNSARGVWGEEIVWWIIQSHTPLSAGETPRSTGLGDAATESSGGTYL